MKCKKLGTEMNKRKKNSLICIIIILIICLFGLLLVKKFNPEEKSFFIPCMFYKTTGLKCPGCGMTRAMHYLVNGNIEKAIWYNLMIVPGSFVLIYSGYRYMRYIVKDEPIVNKTLDYMLKIFLIILIMFMIVRNITTVFY